MKNVVNLHDIDSIVPVQNSKRRWSQEELDILRTNMAEGVSLNHLQKLLPPTRSIDAIAKQAYEHSYGHKKDADGVRCLYENVRRRSKKNISVEETGQVASTENHVAKNIDSIIPKEKNTSKTRRLPQGYAANRKAISMLRNAGLEFDPDVVNVLTKHILKSKSQVVRKNIYK